MLNHGWVAVDFDEFEAIAGSVKHRGNGGGSEVPNSNALSPVHGLKTVVEDDQLAVAQYTERPRAEYF